MIDTHPKPRPGILSIAPYVPGRSSVAGGRPVIKLSSNESALGPSPMAVEAFRATATSLHRYPDGAASGLREAIGHTFGLVPEHIVCGAGSDELIYLLARAYLGPGDEAIFPEHGFLIHKLATLAAGAAPVAAAEVDLTASVDHILGAVSERTRAVFIANPDNPTGTYIDGAQLRRLRDSLPAEVLLVIDSAYADYVTAADYNAGASLVRETDNTVMLRTFSKIYALAALRLGWAFCPPAIADVLNRIRGPFNVCAAAQAAGIAALADTRHTDAARAHNDIWRPWLTTQLRGLGLDVTDSAANFVLVHFPTTPGKTAGAADEFLTARGIILRGVGPYGLPNALRLTVGKEEENRAVVAALAEFMAG